MQTASMISEQVYQPEADTWLLAAAVSEEICGADMILEVGTGSGEIAAGIGEVSSGTVIATDINPHAVRAARKRGVDVVRTDICQCFSCRFDIIICNPPYLPTLPDERIDDWFEYALDGGENGRVFIERFLANISSYLVDTGKIFLLISSLTGVAACEKLFCLYGYSYAMVACEAVEGGESLMVYRLQRAPVQ